MKKQANNRGKGGKFVEGVSGNPAGRPKGARNKVTAAYLELLDGSGEAILDRAIALAKKGDRCALRLCLDRILPARQDRTVEFDLPRVLKAADVATAMAAVLSAVAEARLTVQEGREFAHLLEGQRKALETSELAVRLQLIEDAIVKREEWEQ